MYNSIPSTSILCSFGFSAFLSASMFIMFSIKKGCEPLLIHILIYYTTGITLASSGPPSTAITKSRFTTSSLSPEVTELDTKPTTTI